MLQRMERAVYATLLAALLTLGGVAGYYVLRGQVAATVYRERLEGLAKDYESLRGSYNAAVKRAAVTELVVEQGKLFVAVRGPDGVVKQWPTPYDPKDEIHVDFIVVDGRLWIRRVYDSKTPAKDGVVLDPALADLAWTPEDQKFGLAVYRAHLDEGRWVVSATANGALSLRKSPTQSPATLQPAPPIRDFEPLRQELEQDLGRIGPGDVWRYLANDK